MSQPSVPIPRRIFRVLPQMCSRTRAPIALIAATSFCLVGQDELVVELRADQRGRGVADADQVGARLDLGPGEGDLHRHDELEQLVHEVRVVVEVEHQGVQAAEVGRHGTRAFHPALDDERSARLLLQQRDGLDPVAHPARGGHVGQLERLAAATCRPAGPGSRRWRAAGRRTTPRRRPGRTPRAPGRRSPRRSRSRTPRPRASGPRPARGGRRRSRDSARRPGRRRTSW